MEPSADAEGGDAIDRKINTRRRTARRAARSKCCDDPVEDIGTPAKSEFQEEEEKEEEKAKELQLIGQQSKSYKSKQQLRQQQAVALARKRQEPKNNSASGQPLAVHEIQEALGSNELCNAPSRCAHSELLGASFSSKSGQL